MYPISCPWATVSTLGQYAEVICGYAIAAFKVGKQGVVNTHRRSSCETHVFEVSTRRSARPRHPAEALLQLQSALLMSPCIQLCVKDLRCRWAEGSMYLTRNLNKHYSKPMHTCCMAYQPIKVEESRCAGSEQATDCFSKEYGAFK